MRKPTFVIKKKLQCDYCKTHLNSSITEEDLTAIKSDGFLNHACKSVVEVCKYTERVFTTFVCGTNSTNDSLHHNIDYTLLVNHVLNIFAYDEVPIFTKLEGHWEQTHTKPYKKFLIRFVIDKYFQTRFHPAAKRFTDNCKKKLKTAMPVGQS